MKIDTIVDQIRDEFIIEYRGAITLDRIDLVAFKIEKIIERAFNDITSDTIKYGFTNSMIDELADNLSSAIAGRIRGYRYKILEESHNGHNK